MATKSQVKNHDDTLKKAVDRFSDSWGYAANHWHGKWDRDGKLYDNESTDSTYHGVTDAKVPMVFSTIETMVAALNNANLRFDYKSSDPLRQPSTAPLNALVDEWWEMDQWDLALEESVREMLKKGMSGGMFSWEMDHPHLDVGAMRDYIVDPTIKNPAQLQQAGAYAGRRFLVRREALDEFEVVDTDENSKTYMEVKKRFNIPEDAKGSTAPDKEDDKSHQELTTGSTLPEPKGQDELIEIWDIDRVVTVMNRKFVIEDIENPYKARHRTLLRQRYEEAKLPDAKDKAEREARGLVPFFFLRNYRNTSLFYARSEVDAIASLQELLNDMTSMEFDYIIRQLAPQKELDPAYADFLDMISNDPDVVYPFKPGSLVDRPTPILPANSFNNRMNIKNEIRETTAVDQLAKGIANVKQTTATEVDAQMNQTSQRIESKARIIEKDGLYWMAYIVFRMFQLYVDEPMVVQVKGQDTSDLRTTVPLNGEEVELPKGAAVLDPKDYQGDWRPSVSLEVDAMSKQADQRKAAKESFQILIQDPTNNLEEIKKRLFPVMFPELDRDDLLAITTPDPAQQQMGGAVDPMTGAPVAPGPGSANVPTGPADQMAAVAPPEAAGAPVGDDVDYKALSSEFSPEELAMLEQALQQEAA